MTSTSPALDEVRATMQVTRRCHASVHSRVGGLPRRAAHVASCYAEMDVAEVFPYSARHWSKSLRAQASIQTLDPAI